MSESTRYVVFVDSEPRAEPTKSRLHVDVRRSHEQPKFRMVGESTDQIYKFKYRKGYAAENISAK